MNDQQDNFNLRKVVSDDDNQVRKLWSSLGQSCSRSLIAILSQIFFILLSIVSCSWRIHLWKTCDGSTVRVRFFCSAAGYILLPPRL